MKYTLYTLTESHTIAAQEIVAPEHDGYLMGSVHLEEQSRWGSQYARQIRSPVRGLWNGTFDTDQAFDSFRLTVNNGLTGAWYRGAAECGIRPADLSPEEKTALAQTIHNEQRFIFPFLFDIEKNNKASGGKWGPIKTRADSWGLRYDDVVSRARLMACADKALEWVQGPTSDKCATCTRMNGKVKRASFWQRNGVHPRAPENFTILCRGWKCLCELVPTDKPLSRGPLPKWP